MCRLIYIYTQRMNKAELPKKEKKGPGTVQLPVDGCLHYRIYLSLQHAVTYSYYDRISTDITSLSYKRLVLIS